MKAELFDYPLAAAETDLPSALREFLGDDFGRSHGIEEVVSDHLANHLDRSTVMGPRAAPLTLKCLGTHCGESCPQLKVSLLAEAKLLGGLDRSQGSRRRENQLVSAQPLVPLDGATSGRNPCFIAKYTRHYDLYTFQNAKYT